MHSNPMPSTSYVVDSQRLLDAEASKCAMHSIKVVTKCTIRTTAFDRQEDIRRDGALLGRLGGDFRLSLGSRKIQCAQDSDGFCADRDRDRNRFLSNSDFFWVRTG